MISTTAEQVQSVAGKTSLSIEPAHDFLQMVEEEVLSNERVVVSPDQLFASATEAIDIYLGQSKAILSRL